MNNSLKEEILKIFGANLITAEWTCPPEKVAEQILNLVASKMPEKKEVQTHGELNREGWSRYDYAAGYNQAITDVKSILKGEESQ
jgi:hypothetical protein